MRGWTVLLLNVLMLWTGLANASAQDPFFSRDQGGQFANRLRMESRLSASWASMHVKMTGIIDIPGNFPFREKAELYHEITHRLEGVWAEWSQRFFCTDNLIFRLDAGYLFPANREAKDSMDYRNTFIFRTLLGGDVLTRNWSTRNEWWSVDGSLNYSIASNCAVVAGIRYEFFDTRYQNPQLIVVGGTPVSTPGDIMDITRNIILPYIGLEYSWRDPGQYLALRAITLPRLAGYNGISQSSTTSGVTRSETKGGFASGSFGEISLTWQINRDSKLRLCLLTKVSFLQGKTETEERTIVTVPGDLPFSAPTVGTMYRTVYSVGGEIGFPFAF